MPQNLKTGIPMARPQKAGLNYFPLDTDMDQDDKISLVEAKHGITGFGIIIKLFMKIYREGYCYKWGEREQLLFSKRVNVDINSINDVINDAIRWELFDNDTYEKHGILTSRGIQKRFVECARRRQKVEIDEKHLLLCQDIVNEYNNVVIVNINSINGDNGTQSKVNKSKVNKTKTPNDDEFLKFYQTYPVKKSKQAALKAWNKLQKDGDLPSIEIILGAIQDQSAERIRKKQSKQFCPEWKHPSTWLNQKCWEDETESCLEYGEYDPKTRTYNTHDGNPEVVI
jgi:hypothetical protein